ncbi:Subtilisin-like protease SBT5.6 [Sesamum alatum]|uniref:Subtilisin-like protease SBT5.6 n=1 Tax=Sesamum alatum TaxID=300844 RepID=A0AAE2CZF8_9LAMI|nr:Subtilisin-like protease SBT5.6 [Sesamum alatum]
MENLLSLLLLLLLLPLLASSTQVYIVYLGEHSGVRTFQEIEENHHSYLLSVKETEEDARTSLVYSYKNSINGFAARLTPHEANRLSEMEEVVSVIRSNPRKYSMHTTRSWEFAGLQETATWKNLEKKEDLLIKSRYGEDVIVGILDNGVWPESRSFNDEGMGPIPQSWKGVCQSGDAFNSSHCNKKIIGARYYIKGYEAYYGPLNRTLDSLSPRDMDGHGTHTSSTVGGRKVKSVSAVGGFASGTASGGAPLARLAIYKVCWAIPGQGKEGGNTCFEEDMLAAIDDAIADGVDVLSISIGTKVPVSYDEDGIAIGALHAIKKNIVVACSAGNSGPAPSTLSNPAPWIITIGASSVDRIFSAPVVLGNGKKIMGQTVTPYKLEKKLYPLVYAAQVTNPDVPNNISGQCLSGTLSKELVQGKIVLCLSGYSINVEKGLEVRRAGGLGFILQNPVDGISISVDAHVLPGTAVLSNDSATILNYIKSSKNPTARIVSARTVLGSKPSPFMAGFSSTGPNALEPNILKPDITAPGLNILAAWSEATSPTKLFDDNRVVKYNILSGTSMSCPHVAAAAVLIKARHPNWSSAAIRSALMTTATQTNNLGLPITDGTGNTAATPFHYGSGHFRPEKAVHPGLIYDANYTDYLLYLCNYNSSVRSIDPSFTCPDDFPSPSDLNYPSIAVSNISSSGISIRRTVTNVGAGASVYEVRVEAPVGYTVEISPETMNFSSVGQRESFNIFIRPESGLTNGYAFGSYTWSDGIHTVRSPIVVSSH